MVLRYSGSRRTDHYDWQLIRRRFQPATTELICLSLVHGTRRLKKLLIDIYLFYSTSASAGNYDIFMSSLIESYNSANSEDSAAAAVDPLVRGFICCSIV